jgi:hypothetical protein
MEESMSKRRTPKLLPPCANVKSREFEWEDSLLSKAEIRAMRDRLARASRDLDAEALRRVLAVAELIEGDRVWLAEYDRRAKERAEMIAAVLKYVPRSNEKTHGDRERVARRIATRAVRRHIGGE